MEFKNKVVLITGASSGIGAATAIHFAKLGAKVTLTGRNEKNLKHFAQLCEKENKVKAQIIVADLARESDARSVIQKTIEYWGQLDVLINNAGKGAKDSVMDESLIETYDDILATNVRSVVILTTLAVPYLLKTQGNIINISSVCALKPSATMISYCVSKSALDQFTKCTALDLAPKGIRVNSVNPGPVVTNFAENASLANGDKEVDAFYGNIKDVMPLKIVSVSKEIAELIAFLASDKARSITGSVFVQDCGFMIKS